MKETDLYPAIKSLFEGQGYTVKGEIGKCDVVAQRGDAPPVIVEMKTGITIALLLQGIDRLSISDSVYLAVPRGKAKNWRKTLKGTLKICRRLGLGFITVTGTQAEVHLDPGPYQPRKSAKKQARLMAEFKARRGDPNTGGTHRSKIITAYRQEAIRVAEHLLEYGPSRPAEIARAVDAPKAQTILSKNHYGWFMRLKRGIYDLTPDHRSHLEE